MPKLRRRPSVLQPEFPVIPKFSLSKSSAGLQRWEIVICADLTENHKDLLNAFVEVPANSRGTIFFDSCGGSAYAGLALASVIRLRGLKAAGVVAGECSSAALMPFAACSERYVTTHSSLLFHPIRWQSEEQVRLDEAAEWTRHFQVMEADHDQLMARLFGCEISRIKQWSHPGRFVVGAELAAAGLASLIDLFSGTIWSQIASRTSEE